MTHSISSLQAACGRFLTGGELYAWEHDSRQRCTDLVRAFQRKELDPDALHAALAGERLGAPRSTPPSSAIAVIELTGVLMPSPSIFSLLGFGTSTREFTAQINAAAFDAKIRAILVLADTPGGSVRGAQEAAMALRTARTRKLVVVHDAGLLASAGYWIGSGATVIEATPSASAGSIGVLAERISIAKQLARDGVDVHVFASGRYKSEGHEALPMSDAEGREIQRKVDAAKALFVDDVAAGRQVPRVLVDPGYGEGRLFDAPEALRLGMIDRVATIDNTLARLVAAPAAFQQVQTARADHARAQIDGARREAAREEIAGYRARMRATMR